jgi:hypothetical protein
MKARLICKLALAMAIFVICLTVGSGYTKADTVVTVGSTNYDLSTCFGTYADCQDQIDGSAWWGNNRSLAESLAAGLGQSFGLPGLGGFGGPYFAYAVDGNPYWIDAYEWSPSFFPGGPYNSEARSVPQLGADETWAVEASTPEPSVLNLMLLSLLGWGLLIGVKRYRENHLRTEA